MPYFFSAHQLLEYGSSTSACGGRSGGIFYKYFAKNATCFALYGKRKS
jgi:hypothetical protein